MRKQNAMGYAANQKKDDRGFYIILAICLVVIVVSGYVLFFSPSEPADGALDQTVYTPAGGAQTDTAAVAVPDVDVPAQPAVQPEEPAPAPAPEPERKAETAAPTEPTAPIWVRPVAGEVQKAFSGDTLVKDATMGDWRVHTGTDYAAASGTRVYAVSDGTVESVETGTLYGACVTLQLADGKTAVYRGLSEKVKVKPGASVRAGDVIGTVGVDNTAEAAEAAHLHLELYEADAAIDPEQVFGGGQTGQAEPGSADAHAPVKTDTSAAQSGIDVEE